jgi:hypothetical protein
MLSPRQHLHAGQLERLTIVRVDDAWEIREEHNHRLVHVVRYTDWHRVERVVQLFERRSGDAVGST